ncbi:unnamed protein product [Cylicocyclus nassatus]|uniref:Uncharacterized protein n=1 Tax=Cylicocyclus nassatus TaxID=53992 RepID=A0AA36M9B0_CYLNA|nr:unnamed protein product [Cylicocyclus nassatus]
MLQKNLKDLKRSISAKFGKRSKSSSQSVQIPTIISDHQCATSSHDDEDPYREILRTYSDNVSHLVFHGSSLKSMRSFDSDKSVNQPEFRQSSSDTHLESSNQETNLKSKLTLRT